MLVKAWKCCYWKTFCTLDQIWQLSYSNLRFRRKLSPVRPFSTDSSYENNGKYNNPPEVVIKHVVFLGNDSFSVPSLKILIQLYSHENITVVVSHEKNIVGKFSNKNMLKVILWEDFKLTTKNQTLRFDLGVVASFGYLIPKYVIQNCLLGILNVHASLLPNWRGAAPIAHAIMNGDEMTGVSIMKIAPHKFDVGPVLLKKETKILEHIKAPELTNILAQLGAEALQEVLNDLPTFLGKSSQQSLNEGTLAPKLTPDIAQINWHCQSPSNIYNVYRGLYGIFRLRSNFKDRRVDFDEMALAFEATNSSDNSENEISVSNFPRTCDNFKQGQFLFWNKLICVKCFNPDTTDRRIRSNWIFIKKIKIGSKWMSATDFNNGFLSKSKSNNLFVFNNDSTEDKINSKLQPL